MFPKSLDISRQVKNLKKATKHLSLFVLAVMPVTSVKPAGIFSHVLESTQSVIGPLTFSGI